MRKLIAILEHDPSLIQEMSLWLDDRLGMYERVISADPRSIIRAIRAKPEDVLILSVGFDRSNAEDSSNFMISYLLERSAQFPVLTYSSFDLGLADTNSRLARQGWIVTEIGPIQGENWVGAVWYPALKKTLRQFVTVKSPLPPAASSAGRFSS